jgi:hypothetical protein
MEIKIDFVAENITKYFINYGLVYAKKKDFKHPPLTVPTVGA